MSAAPVYVDRLRALRESRITSLVLTPVEAPLLPSLQPPSRPLDSPPQAIPATRPAVPFGPVVPLIGLPDHLGRLVQAAARGALPKGPVILVGGLVLDLSGYVQAWASSWPADREHTLRRLEEAHAVWTGQSDQPTGEFRQSATGQVAQFETLRGEIPHVESIGEFPQFGGTSQSARLPNRLGQIDQVPEGPR